jgi:hypothetical protein
MDAAWLSATISVVVSIRFNNSVFYRNGGELSGRLNRTGL